MKNLTLIALAIVLGLSGCAGSLEKDIGQDFVSFWKNPGAGSWMKQSRTGFNFGTDQ